MSIRKLVAEYPDIFSKDKYKYILEQDAGDPGVSMEYYIDEIIGIDDFTYDDYLGAHKITEDEERKLLEKSKKYPETYSEDYSLLDELSNKGLIKLNKTKKSVQLELPLTYPEKK